MLLVVRIIPQSACSVANAWRLTKPAAPFAPATPFVPGAAVSRPPVPAAPPNPAAPPCAPATSVTSDGKLAPTTFIVQLAPADAAPPFPPLPPFDGGAS